MTRRSRPSLSLPRRAALAVLAAALLPRPAAVRGQTGGSCHAVGSPAQHPDFLWWPVGTPSGAPADPTVRLWLGIGPAGSARVRGHIRRRGDDETSLLVAEPGTARAACADLDGDGAVGLTRVEFEARDARTGARVPVVVTTRAGEEFARTGFGFVTFQDGDGPAVEVEVRIGRRRRRRNGGRR
jgi:hypothetical protein